jgi:hypothetical protein
VTDLLELCMHVPAMDAQRHGCSLQGEGLLVL